MGSNYSSHLQRVGAHEINQAIIHEITLTGSTNFLAVLFYPGLTLTLTLTQVMRHITHGILTFYMLKVLKP